MWLVERAFENYFKDHFFTQDKDDDQLIGVKSTALLFGDHTKLWLSCFTATMTTGLCMSGYFSEQLWPYYLAVAGTCSHLTWQVLFCFLCLLK